MYMETFEYKGHNYKVVPIEGSEDSIIVQDGRKPKRIGKEIAARAMEYVDKLFAPDGKD